MSQSTPTMPDAEQLLDELTLSPFLRDGVRPGLTAALASLATETHHK